MGPEEQPSSRHAVASYTSYAEAERAVDSLADQGFPVGCLTILARDLRLVEEATGRMGYGRAAFEGATAGGLVGALLGFLFGLLSWIDPLTSGLAVAFYCFLIGASIGLVSSLLTHAVFAGNRNFSSRGSISAGSYVLVADDLDEAERAAQMLAGRQLQRA